MRIGTSRESTELTARARLRSSAIDMFALHGFDASVREIAAHAGVTAGLITHHFGTKNALREECDAEVLRQYSTLKKEGIAESPTETMAKMAEVDDYAPMLVYILRSVREGGPAGVLLLKSMIDDAVTFSEEGVARGMVHPSRDPVSRARYLVTSSVGGLLLQLSLLPQLDLAEIGPTVRRLISDITLPTLEVYTEGVLTDHRYLDEYLRSVADVPGIEKEDAAFTPSPNPTEKLS